MNAMEMLKSVKRILTVTTLREVTPAYVMLGTIGMDPCAVSLYNILYMCLNHNISSV